MQLLIKFIFHFYSEKCWTQKLWTKCSMIFQFPLLILHCSCYSISYKSYYISCLFVYTLIMRVTMKASCCIIHHIFPVTSIRSYILPKNAITSKLFEILQRRSGIIFLHKLKQRNVNNTFWKLSEYKCRCTHKMFLKISQNSQENILLKNRLWRRCFLVNFVKFLRIPFLRNTSGRLLL